MEFRYKSLIHCFKRSHLTIYILTVCLLLQCLTSCKKFVEVNPPQSGTNSENVYTDETTAAAVLTGIYSKISRDNATGFQTDGVTSLSLFPGLSSDELTLFNPNNTAYLVFYRNELSSALNVSTADYWSSFYPVIFTANSAIEGLQNSSTLNSAVRDQLLGEAKFIRAFCYFYLVNLYGDVPLVLSTDWQQNSNLSRLSKSQVYDQIILDLEDAKVLLSGNYLKADAMTPYTSTSIERVRPTKWAAAALLARTYLYTDQWAKAEAEATSVIENNTLFGLDSLNGVFLKNSKEAIWQLQPVRTGTNSNTGEGKLFILPDTGPNDGQYPIYLSNNVVMTFETGDQRNLNWTRSVTTTSGDTFYYPFKYKIGAVDVSAQEYIMVLRIAEQYLIRSEARANLGDATGAVVDLNVIRERSGLPDFSAATTTESLLSAILHERQVELFTEWGHRWFDLKRTNSIDSVMSIVALAKGGSWSSYKALFPIPQTELSLSPNISQNPGY
jgi:starch-binding outer membrane protein, SusD/RagB family